MKTGMAAAIMAAMLLGAGPGWADDAVHLTRVTDYDGAVTYVLKTATELKVLQHETREEAQFFSQALARAQQRWQADAGRAGTSFPAGRIHARKVATVGMPTTDREKAQAKVDDLQSKEDGKNPQRGSAVNEEASTPEAERMAEAQTLLRAALKELRAAAEAQMAERLAVAAATREAAGAPAGDPAAAFGPRVPLDRLRPVASEWGTGPHPLFPDLKSGPFLCLWGPNGNPSPNFWPDNVKIIPEEAKAANPVPEGKPYTSTLTNCFAVAGEYVSGVGLWARRMTFYHWLEYQIPANAHAFKADLYVTDDAAGFCWWRLPANQMFTASVAVDGREVYKLERVRVRLEAGAGALLDTLLVPLAPGAKTIRFRIENGRWGDGNCNTELVLHDGAFLL